MEIEGWTSVLTNSLCVGKCLGKPNPDEFINLPMEEGFGALHR